MSTERAPKLQNRSAVGIAFLDVLFSTVAIFVVSIALIPDKQVIQPIAATADLVVGIFSDSSVIISGQNLRLESNVPDFAELITREQILGENEFPQILFFFSGEALNDRNYLEKELFDAMRRNQVILDVGWAPSPSDEQTKATIDAIGWTTGPGQILERTE